MKLTVERNALAKALARTQRVVERRNTYPILANILLEATGNSLTLRATDLDIEVTDVIAANVSTNGTTTVPASTLNDLVRKYADGSEISMEVVGEQVLVKSGRSKVHLSALSPDSFPDLKSGNFTHKFTIAGTVFADLLARSQFAISNEETRYYLNGIYLHVVEGNLRAVATDGHRMARTAIPAPDGAEGMPGVIVPKKTVGELIKLLDGNADEIEVEFSDSKVLVSTGDFRLLSKLIEGTFPDYERVTPKNNDKFLTADRKALIDVVGRVSIMSEAKGGKAVKFIGSPGQLELQVTNPDHGTATEDMAVDFAEKEFTIGFNARYLNDVLGNLRGENIKFAFNDAGSPALLSDPADGSFMAVLMPLRV